MKSTEHIYRRANGVSRLMKWPLLCGLLALASARVAAAADSFYINNAIVNFPLYNSIPPVIDATNFVNNNQFIINFASLATIQPFYETSDTLNYTNNGLMMDNTGFQFDNQSSATGLRTMSASFYNPGTVSCGSINNLGDPYGGSLYLDGIYPQCIVNASNIVNPGTVEMGEDGLIQFTGQNVDLTRSRLISEVNVANVFGTGYFGLNASSFTNGNTIYTLTPPWDPSIYLGPNYAESGIFPVQPIILYLPNSTAYFQFDSPSISNNIIRSVFIEDSSPTNVAYNVYFDSAGLGFGGGAVTIEWVGSYQDIATGNNYNNYLYLNNNYLESVATNDGVLGAIPLNFTFTESPVKQIFQAPAPAGFYNVFPSGTVTNRYAFANAQLFAGTWPTNQIGNLSVTNLPGRVQINASHELNLALAQINGPNYMSLQSTNQFDGSPGASIQVPYSDLNLGVTNGFLTVSNLLTPQIASWSGNVQAWSTRFTTTSSNSVVVISNGIPVSTNLITVTNDFRVLIVGSQLTPTTVAQVQNMILHGTNTVISDALNVMRSITGDGQSLTLSANGFAKGATSLDGELNLASPDIFWSSSLPNLLNLTNNGAIRLQNLSYFIGTSNSAAVTPALAAGGTLSEAGGAANVQSGNRVVIGANAYSFVTSLVNTTPNQVKIAAQFDGTMNNLIAAINGAAGAGTAYSTNTAANPLVAAGALTGHAFAVAARVAGSSGNVIAVNLSVSTTNLAWSGTTVSNTLAGGMDGVTNVSSAQVPYHNFINNGLLSDQGSEIWATNFANGGVISNGLYGPFTLQSQTATLTNGQLVAGGDVSITTGNFVASNLVLEADRSLTLAVTNQLTDTGVTNGSVWLVGAASGGNGLSLPDTLPSSGGGAYGNSLLGTTITLFAPASVNVMSTWSARDLGVSNAGYTNNVAVGQLILDALGPAAGAQYYFTGTGASNAIYVDRLELSGYASYTNHDSGGNLPALAFNTNLVIYYADCIDDNYGDVSLQLNHKNNDHLRWVPSYAGYFSSTNLVYLGTTNTYNVALAKSTVIDSNGNGLDNAADPMPFFLSSMVNQTGSSSPPFVIVSWNTVPLATNFVFYSTNMNDLNSFTNIASQFISPMPYPGPVANISTNYLMVAPPRYYRVMVYPWLTYPY